MLSSSNSSSSTDVPQKFLQIKQDDKFFARLLSKENSSVTSFRVYYGGVKVAVPFLWESQPGTPNKLYTFSSDNTSLMIPPLTPPPSFYNSNIKKPIKKHPSTTPNILLQTLFPRSNSKKTSSNNNINNVSMSPSVTSLSSSSSSSSSLMSSWSFSNSSVFDPVINAKKSLFSTPGSSFDSTGEDDARDHEHGNNTIGPPTSTLCFSFRGCCGW